MLEAGKFGIRDSLGHVISREKLDSRTQETVEILSLLRQNPVVILTAEANGEGKSTFARILRNQILTQTPKDDDFPDCVYTTVEEIKLGDVESERQDELTTRDNFSYKDLRRLRGLIILDEFYPEYLPLALTFTEAKLLLIIQPNFLQGPSFDNQEHKQLVQWVIDSKVPIYKLGGRGIEKNKQNNW